MVRVMVKVTNIDHMYVVFRHLHLHSLVGHSRLPPVGGCDGSFWLFWGVWQAKPHILTPRT